MNYCLNILIKYILLKTHITGLPSLFLMSALINWIGKEDLFKIISEIEQDFDNISSDKKPFFTAFLEWLREALDNASIIVVEGNQ